LRGYNSAVFALYIIMAWILLGIIALTYFYYRKDMKMTSATTGEVISATNREVRDDNGRRDETVIVARYSVSGREYELSHVFLGRSADKFPVGRVVPVRYNPSDPKMAKIPTG
jgi:Protein of unknown function (DUF3592)